MINVESYLNDGANWQAQCILAYIRYKNVSAIENTWNNEMHKYDAEIKVGRLENCREQGYVFTPYYHSSSIGVNYWVYEHRNTDKICIKKFNGSFMDTPTINDIVFKDKYDYTIDFKFGEIIESGDWIIDDMFKEIQAFIAKKMTK